MMSMQFWKSTSLASFTQFTASLMAAQLMITKMI